MPRKSWIATPTAAVQAAVAPIVEAVKAVLAPVKSKGDPWYRNDERVQAVNEEREVIREGKGRWVPRRRKWLR